MIFELNQCQGAAGYNKEGFIGRCPYCNHFHGNITENKIIHDDNYVNNLVEGIRIAGDNLAYRIFEKLWDLIYINHSYTDKWYYIKKKQIVNLKKGENMIFK